jgi:pumilio RNA-binding family
MSLKESKIHVRSFFCLTFRCRVVQKALETMEESDVPKLLNEFHNNVLSCIHDQNGNHVIQKCIEVMSKKSKKAKDDGDEAKAEFFSEQIDFIIDDVLGNVTSLSCHPYGCRVLQRILEHCVEPKKCRALDEISLCHKTLLDDQYGNYVIQHVLQFGRNSDQDSILQIVVENGLLLLSRQKFASNVVEKLLKYGTAPQRKAVVREMLKVSVLCHFTPSKIFFCLMVSSIFIIHHMQVVDDRTGAVMPAGSEGTSVVLLMVRDAYANYVVQTTLDVIPECEEKKLLLEELNSHSTELVSQSRIDLFLRRAHISIDLLIRPLTTDALSFSAEKLHFCETYCYKVNFLICWRIIDLPSRTELKPTIRVNVNYQLLQLWMDLIKPLGSSKLALHFFP